MNEEIKTRWLAALRSGEYKQGTGVLRSEYGFCCLGVLCDIVKDDLDIEWYPPDDDEESPYEIYRMNGETEVPPLVVENYAQLLEFDPKVIVNGEESSIGYLNDNGSTFEEIADLIEAQL